MLTTIEMKQNAIAALTARINHDLKMANEHFDANLVIGKNLKVEFNLKGRAAGQAVMTGRKAGGFDSRKYAIRFNVNMMIMNEKAWWHMLDETVSHEIAHVVDYVQRQKSGHDSRWKFLHEMLGGQAHTYHQLELATAEYEYNVHGKSIKLGQVRHNKVMAGHYYLTTVNGVSRRLDKSHFVGEVQKTAMNVVPTRDNEVAPYTVKTNVVDTQKKVAIAKAKVVTPVAVVAPKALPVAANTAVATPKRHMAPSGLLVAHKPSKTAVQIWENGIKTKAEFIAAYEAAGCKNADRTFSLVVAWFVGKK
ncbi:hypothetical protein AsFcp4_216 [Aeromonas phage AsFcp_4]|uniref:SprT-like domain-containing protein n=1 Tax=Aeromonas phage PX29 TaxID=926067 RepID=E5DPZ1_9CAUD|nr:hypothetical protein CL89_gp058 [Aeromonas phage PX29]ADQ52777.1 conserved hypothetical protein [Aeromonas phage PX29]QAX98637.1 hypothetical protein ASfcp2_304 [Aeromonas phage AsFcp_2]QAX99669.1 hypothetical protein AsFcp4_216 [Aeromonas phage AsFcp_4]